MYLGIDQKDGKLFFDLEFECCGSIVRARAAQEIEKMPKTMDQIIEQDVEMHGTEVNK